MLNLDICWEYKIPAVEEHKLTNMLHRGVAETIRRYCPLQEAEVSITIVDNNRIQDLNRLYRGFDQPTDVLSFALKEENGDEPGVIGFEDSVLGDIVISLERAREQAEEYGHSLYREIVYLAVHGTLHLLGYDHGEETAKRDMRSKEEEIMACMGLERG